MTDIVIVGGGPAGLTAAIYALRGGASVVLIEKAFIGGQTARLNEVANFPSYDTINGFELTQKMHAQATALGLQTTYAEVRNIVSNEEGFSVTHSKGDLTARAVIIATGAERISLGIEQEYVGRGVSYCATCDGMFFRNKTVAVAGSGKRAVEECEYLSRIVDKVYFIFGGEENVKSRAFFDKLPDNVEVLYAVRPVQLLGDGALNAVVLEGKSGRTQIDVDGLFVSMGSTALVGLVANILNVSKDGICVDKDMTTSRAGIFACGDCTDGKMKQIVTACADGAKAAEGALEYLNR